jgi:hypothetical protein
MFKHGFAQAEFPVLDGHAVDANTIGHLALEQVEFQTTLA